MWWFGLPCIAMVEVIYVIRHPRSYKGSAMIVGVGLAVLSYVLLARGFSVNLVYLTQVVAVVGYYVLKLNR